MVINRMIIAAGETKKLISYGVLSTSFVPVTLLNPHEIRKHDNVGKFRVRTRNSSSIK